MHAEDEAQRMQRIGVRKEIRESQMEHPLIDAESLNGPAGAPDIGCIGDAVRRLSCERIDLSAIGAYCIAQCFRVTAIVHEGHCAADEPADLLDALGDELLMLTQELGVFPISSGDEELRGGTDRERRVARLGAFPYLQSDLQAFLAQRIVVSTQSARRRGKCSGSL